MSEYDGPERRVEQIPIDHEDRRNPHKEENQEKKQITLSINQIIAGAVSVIILGALGYVGTIVSKAVDQSMHNKEEIRVINTILETDLTNKLTDIDDTIKEYNTRMGSTNAQIRQLEIMINRLDAIINRLEGN